MLVLQIAVLVTSVYAFVHAALQRPDAYTAADKMTKPVWLIILGLSVALTSILGFVFGVLGMAICLLYTSPSPRDRTRSRMPSSA